MRFLFLLAVLASPSAAPLIAIDEPETGLHPAMLPIIADYAVDAAQRSQVILTTHSPAMLDAFKETIPVTTMSTWEHGETVLNTVEGSVLDQWLKDYSLGKLFTSGELEQLCGGVPMKFILFVEGYTEFEGKRFSTYPKRWLDARLRQPVGISTVRFDGWPELVKDAQVGQPKFRQFLAVHEVEAWLLSEPNLFPREVREAFPDKLENPETVNFLEPPGKLLSRLYKRTGRNYKKRVDGPTLFDRADPARAYLKRCGPVTKLAHRSVSCDFAHSCVRYSLGQVVGGPK